MVKENMFFGVSNCWRFFSMAIHDEGVSHKRWNFRTNDSHLFANDGAPHSWSAPLQWESSVDSVPIMGQSGLQISLLIVANFSFSSWRLHILVNLSWGRFLLKDFWGCLCGNQTYSQSLLFCSRLIRWRWTHTEITHWQRPQNWNVIPPRNGFFVQS